MEENYEYLKSKNVEELLKIIQDFNDMNETAKALDLLSDENSEQALEEGLNFLINNAGDEYFQAMIINTLDYIDINKVINCLKNRKDSIQPYLLGEVMHEMTVYTLDICIDDYLDFIMKEYNSLDNRDKERIHEKYTEFVAEFNII